MIKNECLKRFWRWGHFGGILILNVFAKRLYKARVGRGKAFMKLIYLWNNFAVLSQSILSLPVYLASKIFSSFRKFSRQGFNNKT